jgi:RNA polymerase sigma-70 factor (ECF subfamily)
VTDEHDAGAFPSPPDESRSLELVRRIQGGEDAAWNELYMRYHDQLLLAVRTRLGERLRAHLQSEDIFQSVALDALDALRAFEYRGPGSLERFLRTLVMNKIRDRADTFGAQKRRGGVPLTDAVLASASDPATEVRYHDTETYARLEAALGTLPDEQREIVLLRRVDGMSSKEVAEHLGKSDESVRKAYSRALARLATAMTE